MRGARIQPLNISTTQLLNRALRALIDTSRYSVDVCDWCEMPLESCPTCGYALSVHDHICRHCAVSVSGPPILFRLFDPKQLSTVIVAGLILTGLAYVIFFR